MPRILVVDDEPEIMTALQRTLARGGLELAYAPGVDEALSALAAGRFDCALVDLRMPGVGGYGLIRACRRQWPELPLVVLTGHGDKQDVVECLRLGVTDFVSKPWADPDLRAAVGRALAAGGRPAAPAQGPAPAALPAALGAAAARTVEALRGAPPLPALPPAATQLRARLAAGPASAAEAAEALAGDPALAARVVALAGNPHFLGWGEVRDLPAAVARIGLRQLADQVNALTARELYRAGEAALPGCAAAWRHAFLRAAVLRLLAQDRPELGVAPGEAFAVGLFCDAGAGPLAAALAAALPEATPAQLAVLVGEHHGEVSAGVAEAWDLPPACARVARAHHAAAPPGPADAALLLTWGAELVCRDLGSQGDPGGAPVREEVARALQLPPSARALLAGRAQALAEDLLPSL